VELLIDNRQNKYEVKEQLIELLDKAIKTCLLYENWDVDYEVSLSLVDNNEIRELNRMYRGKDYSTDVLSFPLLAEDQIIDIEEKLLGDIVISVEKAAEQAQEYNHSFDREMGFLVVHSMFHLMGYDHDTEDATSDMRIREEAVLASLNLIRE